MVSWFTYYLTKELYPLGENLSKRNYFIDVKYGMDNFNTTDLHRFP